MVPQALPATLLPTAGALARRLSALDELPALQLDGTSECRQPAAATPSQALQQQQQLDCSGFSADQSMQLEYMHPHAHVDIVDQAAGCGQHVQWQVGCDAALQQQCSTPVGSHSCWEQPSASVGGTVHSQPAGEGEATHAVSVDESLSTQFLPGAPDGAGQLVQAEALQTRSSMLDSLPALGLDGTPARCHPGTPHMGILATSASVRRQGWGDVLQQAEPGAYVLLATAATPLEQQQSIIGSRRSLLDSLPGVGLDGTPVAANVNATIPGSLSTTAHTGQALAGRLQTCQTLSDPLPGVTDMPLSAPAAASRHSLQQSQGHRVNVTTRTVPLAKELFPIMEDDGQEGTQAGVGQPLGDSTADVLPLWSTHEDELDELDFCGILPARHISKTTGELVICATVVPLLTYSIVAHVFTAWNHLR